MPLCSMTPKGTKKPRDILWYRAEPSGDLTQQLVQELLAGRRAPRPATVSSAGPGRGRRRAAGPRRCCDHPGASPCSSSFSLDQLQSVSGKAGKRGAEAGAWPKACESSSSLQDRVQTVTEGCSGEDDNGQAENLYPDGHYQRRPRSGASPQRLRGLGDEKYDFIPEKEKTASALTLCRCQEEQDTKVRQLPASEVWDEVRRQEKKLRSRREERQQLMAENLKRWQRDQDQRKAKRRLDEKRLLEARQKEMMLRENKWKRLAQEEETKRKAKLERSKLQAEYRKYCQEKQLREKKILEQDTRDLKYNLLRDKMSRACEKRLSKEIERKKKRQELNQYEMTRHRRLKDQVDHQVKADELCKRHAIEQKLQRSKEILDQLMEERNRESKQKALKEEKRSVMAKFRAKETEEERRRRKSMLLQIAEMKIQQAQEMLAKTIQQKEIEEAIRRRDQKSDQILRDKESASGKARRIPTTSYGLGQKGIKKPEQHARALKCHTHLEEESLSTHFEQHNYRLLPPPHRRGMPIIEEVKNNRSDEITSRYNSVSRCKAIKLGLRMHQHFGLDQEHTSEQNLLIIPTYQGFSHLAECSWRPKLDSFQLKLN
nr:PREDICTED: coiled-coil domain-containing protein 185 [Struthio camelus australis]